MSSYDLLASVLCKRANAESRNTGTPINESIRETFMFNRKGSTLMINRRENGGVEEKNNYSLLQRMNTSMSEFNKCND